jgi:hypothetical protein
MSLVEQAVAADLTAPRIVADVVRIDRNPKLGV